MARIDGTDLVVGRGLRIPLREITLRTSRSSGPGGQHANKTESRVEAGFDVRRSAVLGAGQRNRLLTTLGPQVSAVAQDARSQARNRELALLRLGERLERALAAPRRRVATRPTRSADRRRLQAKRARAEKKARRRRPSADDW